MQPVALPYFPYLAPRISVRLPSACPTSQSHLPDIPAICRSFRAHRLRLSHFFILSPQFSGPCRPLFAFVTRPNRTELAIVERKLILSG